MISKQVIDEIRKELDSIISEREIKMDYELSYLSMIFYSSDAVDQYNNMMNLKQNIGNSLLVFQD